MEGSARRETKSQSKIGAPRGEALRKVLGYLTFAPLNGIFFFALTGLGAGCPYSTKKAPGAGHGLCFFAPAVVLHALFDGVRLWIAFHRSGDVFVCR